MATYKTTPRRQSMDRRSVGESPFDDSKFSIDSKTGSKRLYSNRNVHRPRILENDFEGGSYPGPDDYDEEYPDEKRQRSANWPLPPSPLPQIPSRGPSRAQSRQSRRSTVSPPPRRPSLDRSRPSRFLEGSMNDKVSHLPPRTYLYHEEDLRERFDDYNGQVGQNRSRKMAKPRGFMQHSNISMADASVGGSDASRQSSIFRFGSKIAASIKPSNWKIFSKSQKLPEETPQQKAVRERQEKAERMYHELKSTGYFRDGAILQPGFKPASMDQAPRLKHDSGVELNDQYHSRDNTPMENNRQGRLHVETPELYAESPASKFSAPVDASTPQSARFHMKTPSLSNLKSMSSREYTSTSNLPGDFRAIRKIPSRKEFQNQQKLVKRVSDLEVKLENARRQLSATFAEPLADDQVYQPPDYQPLYASSQHPPARVGRSRFVPGALATLPSERLLSDYVAPEVGFSNDEDFGDIGKALTTQESRDFLNVPASRFDGRQIRSIEEPEEPPHDPMVLDESESELSAIQSQDEVSDNHQTASIVKAVSAHGANVVDVRSTAARILPPKKVSHGREAAITSPRIVKRKSAEGDGIYKPTADSSSDSDSGPDSNIRPIKKVRSSRTRRRVNERTPEPSTPKRRTSNPQNVRKPATRQAAPPSTRNEPTKPESILVKLKMPKTSPPPESKSNVLNYMKPSRKSLSQHSHSDTEVAPEGTAAYAGYGIPPVPKIPQHVRLPSGELLNLHSSKSLEPQRSTPEEKRTTENSQSATSKEPQDWPEDLEIF